jgi:uncharacterized membrane protein
MNRILVAVFPSEVRAYAGLRALEDLDRDGTITLYAAAVIASDEDARVSVKAAAESGPLGTAVALVTGSLLGPLAGPVGLAVAAGAGTLGRVLFDLARLGVEEDFLTEPGARLRPGSAAVVAEVWEDRITPVDARIAALRGSVLRRVRKEIVDTRLERDVAALRAELVSLEAELASALERHRAHLEQRVEAVRTELRAAQHRARVVLDALTRECQAKIAWLEHRATSSRAEQTASLAARISDVRAQCGRRSAKLHGTWEAATQALASSSVSAETSGTGG